MAEDIINIIDYPLEQLKESMKNPGLEDLKLSDIIDVKSVQSILDDFNNITHIPSAIQDLEGNTIASSGWQDICVKFHRANPEACKNCTESGEIFTEKLPEGRFKLYKCKNNLWDVATPLIVNGKHLGNIFIGQFLFDYEAVDYDLFLNQAHKFGFEEKAYMSALEKVPRLSRETVSTAMSFFAKFSQMLSLLSFRNIQLAKSLKEHDILVDLLVKSNEKHKAMVANIADVITIINKDGVTVYVSPNIQKLFGWLPEDLVASPVWTRIHPDDLQRVRDEFSDLMQTEDVTRTIEFRYLCKDGMYKEIGLAATNLQHDSNINGILVNFHDITERKQRENEIQYLNYHDVLTGLYNRAFFEEAIKTLDNERQLPLSVIIGDINGLKLINDAFGHSEGDRYLVAIANILSGCCRKQDILARTGGDEFAILLPGTSGEDVKAICHKIKTACEAYVNKTDKSTYYTSISLGYAAKTLGSEPFEKIMLIAEELMYKRKLLEQKSLHSSILAYIKSTMLEKSQETEEHSERLLSLSKALGQALHLNDTQLNELEILSTLHDIGKVGIDKNILNKPGKLNANEWFEIKKHAEIGYRIAQASSELKPIAEYILCHHERWNGTGYPQGLAGESIPLLSRIIAIVDAYDAMTQDRPYRRAMPIEDAIAEIKRNAGSQFDPNLAKVFVENVFCEIWDKE